MVMDPKNSLSDKDKISKILSPTEAAHVLGITLELLFAYARTPPKRHLGHDITLQYVDKIGRSGFRKDDLEAFDAYLREPWSNVGDSRPSVPSYIEDYLKIECGGQCARCGKGFKLFNAHIVPYEESRSHHHHNLLRLCSECHDHYDAKRLIPRTELQAIKAKLVTRIRERLLQGEICRYGTTARAPNPAAQFVGRDAEVKSLAQMLQDHRAVHIEGAGGMGKTQLLLQTLQTMDGDRRILWIDVGMYATVQDLEIGLCLALSTPGSMLQRESIAVALDDEDVRVVFDGVERMSPSYMDEIQDLFRYLFTMTTKPQFVFTSQAELNDLDSDAVLRVEPLSTQDAMLILSSAVDASHPSSGRQGEDLAWLVEFSGGHPLSLQVVASLIRHFKSPSVVADRIRENGASVLESATRHRQTTQTSLRVCLLVSYQALTTDQRRLLWIASHHPAGCLLLSLEVEKAFGIPDIAAQIAIFQRWHLADVQMDALGHPRIHVLSPIRAFAIAELQTEEPAVADNLRFALVRGLTSQAMIIDERHMQSGDASWGVLRFEQEFPNLLWALQLAVNHSGEDRYAELVGAMANSLMVYCFVRGLHSCGVTIMQFGAKAAVQLGRKAAASDLLLKLMTFGKRLHDPTVVRAAAADIIDLAENSTITRILGNREMARSELAQLEQRYEAAANYAGSAAKHYEMENRRTEATHNKAESNNSEEIATGCGESAQHMLALAYMQEGEAYDKAKRPEAALSCYEQALLIVREVKDPINLGSILNQIGNCRADLRCYEDALTSYFAAAKQFQATSMAEYLSNSLSNAAYVLLEWDPPASVDSFISREMIEDGLFDIAEEVRSVFLSTSPELEAERCSTAILKTFGMMALASFSSYNVLLSDWAVGMREGILRPFVNKQGHEKRNLLEKMLLAHLDLTLALAGTISCVDQRNGIGPTAGLSEVEHYARLCHKYHKPGWRAFRPFEWLVTYLRRHRGLPSVSVEALREAAEAAEEEGKPFRLSNVTIE